MHLFSNRNWLAVRLLLVSGLFAGSCQTVFSQNDNPSYEEGLERMSHHDFEGAIQSFNSCVGANRKFGQAFFKRGQCFYYLQEMKMAIDDFTEAINCDPKKADYFLWRGATTSKVGDDNPHAIMDYEQALRLDPDLLKAAQRNGTQLVASENKSSETDGKAAANSDVTPATSSGEKLAAPADTSTETKVATEVKAGASEGKITNPKSVENYKEALRIVSNDIVAAFVPGTIFGGIVRPEYPEDQKSPFLRPDGLDKILADPKSVFDACRKQLDKMPTDPNLHYRCALALEQMGKSQRALDELSDAISQLPSSSQFFLTRALVQHNAGDDTSAQNDLDRARLIDPAIPASLKLPSKATQTK